MKWLKKPLEKREEKDHDRRELKIAVEGIINEVKKNGDKALLELTSKFDQVEIKDIKINKSEIKEAYDKVDQKSIEMVTKAADNIRFFAEQQLSTIHPLECKGLHGVTIGHRLVPLKNVGCYVPAGRYPLPSSALMSIIPAKVAGVERIAACAPPSQDYGTIHPLVLIAMDLAGADDMYVMGGAQAIAAYRFGTETVDPVDMIVGPGNKYVVEAKRQLSGEVGIDLLAGPSEVLIVADDNADSLKVAIDLLAKCEHDPDAVSILVTPCESFGEEVLKVLKKELAILKTAEVATRSWEEHGAIIVTSDYQEAVEVANQIAPEHLQLITRNDDNLAQQLTNYGSLFIGEYSPVAFGDYCSGTNHTLPTNRCSRFTNGLWVGSFIKVLSYQKVTADGAKQMSVICSHLAEKEGLFAHRNSSDLRK